MSVHDGASRLTAGAFAILLGRLGPDSERAGLAYEHLRRALASFFAWRGAATPEECADETLDRLAKRLGEGVEVQDLASFAHGIARLVLLEHFRRPEARGMSLDELGSHPPAPADVPDDAALADCLERCLAELAQHGRDLILRYYTGEGGARIKARKRLAQALGVSESALRNRAQRVRDQIEGCVGRCIRLRAIHPEARSDTKL